MTNSDTVTRSLFFDIRSGELVEVPFIEYVLIYKQYIMSLIKAKIDPEDEYEDFEVTLVRDGVQENTNLSNVNLDQAIHIALLQGIEKETILSNPEHLNVFGADKNVYIFNYAIFESNDFNILNRLARIIVAIFLLEDNDCLHLFIPSNVSCNIAGSILEICNDTVFGVNISIIDYDHPRREEIEDLYKKP